MNLFFKILPALFALFIGSIPYLFSKKWLEKITHKYKIIRLFLFIILLVLIGATIKNIKDSDTEFKNFLKNFDRVSNDQKKRDESYLTKIDTLNNQLKPFIKVAMIKFPQLKTDAALTLLANDIEKQNKKINAIQYYSEVAMLDVNGKTNNYGYGFIENTNISELLKSTITQEGNNIDFKCNDESIKIYKLIIDKYPTFPFAYYALANCLEDKNDNNWTKYALKCIEILKNTTQISGHNQNHDIILKKMLEKIRK